MRPFHPGAQHRTLAAVVVLALAPLTPLLTVPGSPPAQAAVSTLGLEVPASAVLGDPVQAVATGGPEGARYAWDLDGNGSFETSTGTTPTTVFGFAQGGRRTVSVRMTAGGTKTVARQKVTVARPDTMRVVLDPPNPAPGQKVVARVVTRSDRPAGFSAYVWDVKGVKAQDSSTQVRGKTAGSPAQVLDLSGSGLDVTADPKFSFTMPGGKKRLHDVITVDVTAVNDSGQLSSVGRSVKLDSVYGGLVGDPYQGKAAINCDKVPAGVPAWPCAAMGGADQPLAHVPAVFYDATPTIEVCHTEVSQPRVKEVRISETKNLGYPSPVTIAIGGLNANPGNRPAQAEQRRGPKQKCVQEGALTQSWDWGDGTVTQGGVGESGKGFVYPHTYDEPGTYKVKLTTKVPYFLEGENHTFDKLKRFTAFTTRTIVVGESLCGAVKLNGIAATLEGSAGPKGPIGCFGVRRSLDDTHDVYLTGGQKLRLNGVPVTSTQGVQPVIDPATATVTVTAGQLTAKYTALEGTGVGRDRVVAGPTSTIVVPEPTYDAQLGGSFAALPAVAADPKALGNQVYGLGITAAQVYLSPNGDPREKLFTEMPAPLTGSTPPLVVTDPLTHAVIAPSGAGATPSAAERGSFPGVDTDFEIDLSGMDLGAFTVTTGALGHRKTGGWVGRVTLDVANLGTFEAPFAPPADDAGDCPSTTGPSGVSLTSGGGFEYGGVKALFNPPLAIGPVGLTCLAIKGSSDPFVMSGKAQAQFPVTAPLLTIDACLAFAVLHAGQSGSGCEKTLVASEDTVWFRATGLVRLLGVVDLAKGSIDVTMGSSYQAAAVHGEVGVDFDVFKGSAFVDGTMIFEPEFAYSLIGGLKLCADFGIEFCANAQVGVSSKGYGACASLGGVVYLKDHGWKVFFASCDLKKYLAVQRGIHSTQRGTSATSEMPNGLAKAAYVVHGDGGAPPDLVVGRPDGTRLTDDGKGYQELEGATITKFPADDVTTITLDHPLGGTWDITAKSSTTCGGAGCTTTTPNITVELQTPIPEPVVTGTVTGSGSQRTLQYDAQLDPGDDLVLQEQGPFGTRLLGSAAAAGHTFAIPTAGVAEQRTVTAIIERNGIPYRTIAVDSYQAPPASKLAVPANLQVVVQGGSSKASWEPVPGAKTYEVRGVLSDGRTVRTQVSGTQVTLPGVTSFTGGNLTVRALGTVGLDSAVRTAKLTPVPRVKVSW
ncbi:hypothetical protein H5V45_18245 [Nocardioides sp. KIGAM211]|uniref:PKD domain-containing protein n=1 Tax=Nocardioides luti TaxID=2761101 RepID=A0A7X0RJ35_9ACTN|nr:PKD domain-containing protein [Nocardioides luti]MBB6629274.1 hypothetical protein [Nocardioides luti]